jgi:ribose transport system substrate-binding protein
MVHHHRWTDATRVGASMAAALALTLCVAACGSSSDDNDSSGGSAAASTGASSSADSGSSAVATTMKTFSAPVTWPGPTDPVTPPKAKKITIVTCGSQGITCVRVANGAKAAATALGYQATVIDGRSQPDVWNQAVSSAIASKTNGIVLAAVPAGLVAGGVSKAKAAGIPVVATLGVSGAPTAKVDVSRPDVAKANSAFIAKDSGGNANVLLIRDAEFPETETTAKLYASTLKGDCPKCTVSKEVSFSLALAAQRLAGNVAQVLQQNPNINYIVTPFDTVMPFISQGIRQAGKTGKVKIVGLGADPPSLEAIKSGDQVMSLGNPAEWIGWDAVDAIVRSLAKKDLPAADGVTQSSYAVPQRYVTKDNLPGATGWDGDFDYRSKFKELWGVQ